MRAIVCGFALMLFVWPGADGQTPTLPPEISAVQRYMLETEYPEKFGDAEYRTQINNAVIADLDGDGRSEVLLHFTPHYRQSPTIVIYRVSDKMAVTRVTEGLAPGPLVPLSGDFLDSHTLGEGLDISVADHPSDVKARRKFVDSALTQFASVVEYANWYHVDSREGKGVYIDMTAAAPPPKTKTCEDFEFSAVKQIKVGKVPALGRGNLLAAWVGSKLYIYKINAFTEQGMLAKQMWMVDLAPGFEGFVPATGDGPLSYKPTSGAAKEFAVTCQRDRCTQHTD